MCKIAAKEPFILESPVFLHMQHHFTIQIYLFRGLSSVWIFPLEGHFCGDLNPPNTLPQKEMRISVSKNLGVTLGVLTHSIFHIPLNLV